MNYTCMQNIHFSDIVGIKLEFSNFLNIFFTRKSPLRGYFLGVLTHTTALDRLWGGDETLTMWF